MSHGMGYAVAGWIIGGGLLWAYALWLLLLNRYQAHQPRTRSRSG